MYKREIEAIAEIVTRLAMPHQAPKDLINAVRREYPNASKGEIVRAAFFAVLVDPECDGARARALHDFAMSERRMPDDH